MESSVKELYDSAVLAFPNTKMRQHAVDPIEISNISTTPFIGMKTLFVKALARNEDRQYKPMFLFKNVDYENGPSLTENDVLVRCDCLDHRWRFAYFNHVNKSLYGKLPKKYESNGGPPANPQQLPGLCKHLMATASYLKNQNFLKD